MSVSVIDEALTDLAREHSGRILAILANRIGDLDIADESVQEALVRGAERWPKDGIPDNPPGWLMTVARRIAIDRLRSDSSARRRIEQSGHDLTADLNAAPDSVPLIDEANDATVRDDRLRLLLLCCHPALNLEAQVALTLRLVAGLTTEEIASAFLVPTSTLAQRISRAKRKVRDAGIPLTIPDNLDDRVASVLAVLYLSFNEGYLSRSDTTDIVRVDLCDEAIRLTAQFVELVPDSAEALGLFALELFHDARRDARVNPQRELVLLQDQDRATWDWTKVTLANSLLHRSMQLMAPGPYQLQAHIAARHTNAPRADATDWAAIASLYAQLEKVLPTDVVRLNHAAAVALATSPNAGLDRLASLTDLDGYHLLHSTRARLLEMAGEPALALDSWKRAAELVINPAEKQLIDERITALS